MTLVYYKAVSFNTVSYRSGECCDFLHLLHPAPPQCLPPCAVGSLQASPRILQYWLSFPASPLLSIHPCASETMAFVMLLKQNHTKS